MTQIIQCPRCGTMVERIYIATNPDITTTACPIACENCWALDGVKIAVEKGIPPIDNTVPKGAY
jgi:hypothetical protein